MDPLSIIVLAFLIGAGADLATGGRVRAEFGGGARGAAGYVGSAGRKRWQDSKRLAREERLKTPMGRAVQGILDELGGLGRGLVRGWRSGARRARKQWRDRLGDGPIPAVRICRNLGDQARTWLERRANGDPNEVTDRAERDPNGDPERAPEQGPEQPERAWWDPNGITGEPLLDGPEQDPNDDIEDGTQERCPDCGYPLVLDTLEEHRHGRDRCPEADQAYKPWGLPEHARDTGRTPYNPGFHDGLYIDDEDEIRARHPELNPQPLSEAQCRFWTLRDRGYPGPLNQDGFPVPEPGALGGYIEDPVPYLLREPLDPPPGTSPDGSTPPEGSPMATSWQDKQEYGPDHGPAMTVAAKVPDYGTAPPSPVTPSAPRQPRTEGVTAVADINSAPAAIAAWEAVTPRWESLQSRTDALQGEIDALKNETDALHTEIAGLADSMGDFAIGGEGDVAGAVGEVTAALTSAKEQVDNAATGLTSAKERTGAYVDNLHLEYDAAIEASNGKQADAHRPFQEV